ncbi:MAG: ATP-binding cassette domain-containing protein [Lachnospiraceae bacterium]|nr:ATP-binding cassette domain-containing protein [Lachnospiraceae bacterium]
MEAVNVKNLSFAYPGSDEQTIKDINLNVEEGDLVILCGETGSGKSTFLRLLKEELRPQGDFKGTIEYLKDDVNIGFVTQNPHEQVVTDKVWHELAFGMENMGYHQNRMASRAAEMSEYFGISEWYDKNVNELSGGQLQLLNLASVMVTDPDILILDEPTAQLDPVSTSDFFAAVRKLNRDMGVTVIIAEHRLEELLQADDRLLVMKNGAFVSDGRVSDAINSIDMTSPLFEALPAAYRLYRHVQEEIGNDETMFKCQVPLTVREGRKLVRELVDKKLADKKLECSEKLSEELSIGLSDEHLEELSKDQIYQKPALEMKSIYFRYDRYLPDALSDFDLTVYSGEIFCILGGNASGKTTALAVAAGLAQPYSGTVKVFSKKLKEYKNESLYNGCIAMLPQDVQTLFLYNTVREEIESMGNNGKEGQQHLQLLKPLCDIENLLDKHPYDLSGGEQQIIGLTKVLAAEPRLLLADEPTKGMDAGKKRIFADILKKLKSQGMTVVIVTHDAEFAALCADRCALCFRGGIVSGGKPGEFFENNSFYTTSICRMTKGILQGTVTLDDALDIFYE